MDKVSEIKDKIAELQLQLIELSGARHKVGDCFIRTTSCNIILIEIEKINVRDSIVDYRIIKNDIKIQSCVTSYTSMYDFELSDRYVNISKERHTEIFTNISEVVNEQHKTAFLAYKSIVNSLGLNDK